MQTCRVTNCKSGAEIDGLCSHHHRRWLASGVIDNLRRMSFEERLWSWIDRRGPDECWPWQMRSKIAGYGTITIKSGGPRVLAHRAVYELTKGQIPKNTGYHGAVVMHTCDNRLCCNPAHLVLGTQADNVKDMRAKGRNVDLSPQLGQNHPRAKPLLNAEAIREIRDRSKSRAYLAEKYGIARSNVDNIRGGRTWIHVT